MLTVLSVVDVLFTQEIRVMSNVFPIMTNQLLYELLAGNVGCIRNRHRPYHRAPIGRVGLTRFTETVTHRTKQWMVNSFTCDLNVQ